MWVRAQNLYTPPSARPPLPLPSLAFSPRPKGGAPRRVGAPPPKILPVLQKKAPLPSLPIPREGGLRRNRRWLREYVAEDVQAWGLEFWVSVHTNWPHSGGGGGHFGGRVARLATRQGLLHLSRLHLSSRPGLGFRVWRCEHWLQENAAEDVLGFGVWGVGLRVCGLGGRVTG